MAKLENVEGIGPTYAAKLHTAGVKTTDDLLALGATPVGRKAIAKNSGLTVERVSKWVNQCDLARVKGVGAEYAELLEACGVGTVPELAQRNPDNLFEKMCQVNDRQMLVRTVPSLPAINKWIAQAALLPRIVTF